MMDRTVSKPSILTGALVGGMFSIALVAIFYLAAQVLGTPFVPFDVFDWVGRTLPGGLVTFGIDTIVAIITAFNLGETSSAAKTAEQTLAILGLIVTGVIGGAVLFAVLRGNEVKQRYLPGLILGLVVGIPVMFISRTVNLTATADPLVSSAWILIAFVLWGLAINWAYNQLTIVTPAPAASTPETAAATPSAMVEPLDRRQFLVTLGGASAAITVVGAGLGAMLSRSSSSPAPEATIAETVVNAQTNNEAWSQSNPLPNADAAVMPAPGTRLEFTPVRNHYRIDINTLPPVIREENWRLQFIGLVEEPVEMTLADLRENYQPIDQFVTLACISNYVAGDLIGTQRWTGVPLRDVLKDIKLSPEATHLRISSADAFDEIIDLESVMNDERITLNYAWDGLPLTAEHGFPLRIYIPNHYGMKQPKWITTIEAIPQWEEGYWVRRGWDRDAIMKATSVIDTVAVNAIVQDGDTQLVPIGGIAHAGDRGISRVEVKVDDGEWQAAQLRTPISDLTWVIWRYDWPFQAGDHTFAVRCVEGDSTPQITAVAGSRPSGATGIHTVQRSL
jgi:DMSO/TMAO reductase YedYZ molybdopterin-dependent catalytic subunit